MGQDSGYLESVTLDESPLTFLRAKRRKEREVLAGFLGVPPSQASLCLCPRVERKMFSPGFLEKWYSLEWRKRESLHPLEGRSQ